MISVIMGVYNNEKTVSRAVKSLLDGSYSDIEVICVDDGSTDKSLAELQKLAQSDKRVKVFVSDKNYGLAHALNEGLKNASGEFVARMDGDDFSHPDRLEKQMRFLEENPQISFVGSGAVLVNEKGEKWGERVFPERPDKNVIIKYNPFIHPTLVFKKEALEKVKGYRDIKQTLRCEDYDLIFRLYAEGFVGANLNELLIDYYESENSGKRHSFKTRKNEFFVKRQGAKKLKLGFKGFLYSLKPILLWFLPEKLYEKMHNKKWKK